MYSSSFTKRLGSTSVMLCTPLSASYTSVQSQSEQDEHREASIASWVACSRCYGACAYFSFSRCSPAWHSITSSSSPATSATGESAKSDHGSSDSLTSCISIDGSHNHL